MAETDELGKNALLEVADPREGNWNWAVVAADPQQLELLGAGCGGLEELGQFLASLRTHPVVFGMLRMIFGTGKASVSKLVFISANVCHEDFDRERHTPVSGRDMVRVGQALAKEADMYKVFTRMGHCTLKYPINHPNDLDLDKLIRALRVAETDNNEVIVRENYMGALRNIQDLRKKREDGDAPVQPEANCGRARAQTGGFGLDPVDLDAVADEETEVVVAGEAGGGEAKPKAKAKADSKAAAQVKGQPALKAPALSEKPQEVAGDLATRGQFRLHEPVQIFSTTQKMWHDDAWIMEKAEAGHTFHGQGVPVGSLKVIYGGDYKFKWVLPSAVSKVLRPSMRPAAPRVLTGELHRQSAEADGAFEAVGGAKGAPGGEVDAWLTQFCMLKLGWLQWWPSEGDALQGGKPTGGVPLVGLDTRRAGSKISFTTRVTKGVAFNFDAGVPEFARQWHDMLTEHSEFLKDLATYRLRQT